MDFPYKRENLRLLLIKMGFKFTRSERNSLIHEREYLIAERAKFIRRIREIREKEPHRKIIYTDETWINENHRLKKEWVDLESIQNPYRSLKDFGTVGETKEKCGKGKRLIITDAITSEGPIKDALWIFKASKPSKEKSVKRGQIIRTKCPKDAEEDKKQLDDDGAILMFEEDYHDSMNAEAYESWFERRLCPNLEPNSVIVIDNASYHSRNCPDYPLSTWKKNELSNWLKDKGISFPRKHFVPNYGHWPSSIETFMPEKSSTKLSKNQGMKY